MRRLWGFGGIKSKNGFAFLHHVELVAGDGFNVFLIVLKEVDFTLALLALMAVSRGAGVVIAWICNLWGSADLLNAFYQANAAGLLPGQLGATFFIPTLIVPLLLITHGLVFRILLQQRKDSVMRESPRPA